MHSASDPIGVLDSGLGGLSVLKALKSELPHERFLYAADCAHAPWGDKSEAYVIDRTRTIIRFLIEHGAKAVVLACNTATAAAADTVRREFSLPIVGIEPAVKPAAALTRTGVIGVLATRRTIESERYHSLVRRFAQGVKVVSVAAPGLMECVERGDFQSRETFALLDRYLDPILQAGADKLVLGCTHYPFLSEAIRQLTGDALELLEPGHPVALVTRRRLADLGLLGAGADTPHPVCRYFVAGAAKHAPTLVLLEPDALNIEELNV